MISAEEIRSLPKVELHFHLEGSIRLSTIVDLCKELDVVVPGVDASDPSNLQPYREHFCAATKVENLFAFIDKFWHIQSLLRRTDILERITYEACVDAYSNGVRLLEIRYSPYFILASHYSDHSHLTMTSVHDAILAGIRRAQSEVDIAVGIIGTLDRSVGAVGEAEVFEFFMSHADDFVGLDIANDERCSCIPFAPLYERARGVLGLTAHAGEATDANSVRDTLTYLRPTRIGHGFRAIQDEAVFTQLLESKVLLEICPMSNVLTGSVESIEAHPVRTIFDRGVPISISSDDSGVFDISILDDYAALAQHHGFTAKEFTACNLAALDASFLPAEVKERVRAKYFC